MSRQPTADDFKPYLGKTCSPMGGRPMLTLAAVEAKHFPGSESLPRQPFILLLSGPPGDILPEGLYEIAFEDGPSLPLYIAPVYTASRDRQDYQIIFN